MKRFAKLAFVGALLLGASQAQAERALITSMLDDRLPQVAPVSDTSFVNRLAKDFAAEAFVVLEAERLRMSDGAHVSEYAFYVDVAAILGTVPQPPFN